MPDRRAPGYYGLEVEGWIVERYGLERTYREVEGVRMDAVEPESGRPVEIKAVGSNRAGGRAGSVSWKIWKDQHEALDSANGYYVFVAYELLPDGVGIRDHRAVEVSSLSVDWYGRTEPRGEPQAELKASELF
jgi:hypothetical protein